MTKVTLRRKPLTGKKTKKKESLYLDFYPPIPHPETGKPTRREFLGMEVFKKPTNHFDLSHNNEVLEAAEGIRLKRQTEINKPEVYSAFEKDQLKAKVQGKASYLDYFKDLTRQRQSSNHDNWVSALKYLEAFTNGNLSFEDITYKFCNDFKEYLLTAKSNRSDKSKLSQNSAFSYFNKFKASIKQAYKDGYLPTDINSRIESIKPEETRRNFLTLEELNRLVTTECQNPLMKRAALFSALTGLRFSDIQKLTWGELEYIKDQGYFIHYKQKKTKGIETLPISQQAFELLGTKGEPATKAFEDLTYSAYFNKDLFQWIGAAGITKKITFHAFRHTYATLQIAAGTDIYTVSKMLGHKEIKTTQIYAKIVDQRKRDTTDRIKLDNL